MSAPGVQSIFFLLRSVGRRDLSAGPEQKKKNTTQGVFFGSGPGERQGKEKPRAGTGPEQKKTPPRVFFFLLLRPRSKQNTTQKGRGRRSPVGRRHGARAKKKNTLGVFFALAPCRRPTGLLLPLPFARAAAKKNTLGGVFFFCSGAVPARGFSFPCLSPGPEPKKNTLGGVFFFLLRPRADAHSLTAGLGGDASPSPGWCFFFAVAPPGRSLTHCGLGRFRQGPGGVFFFGCGPAGSFLTITKNVWGTTSGLKRPGGATAKKNTTSTPKPPNLEDHLFILRTHVWRPLEVVAQAHAPCPMQNM